MQRNQTMNRKKRIYTIAALLLTWVICSLMSQKVQAREYPSASTLYVCGTRIIYAGKLEETVVSDGTGGTAVYDYDSNTLTLTNFHGKETANQTLIQADYMGDDFTILLKGDNSLKTSIYHATMNIYNGSLCITGGGNLSLNEGIIGAINKVTIKDCRLDIDATSYGIADDDVEVEIDDAVVNIKVTKDGILHQLAAAINAKKLTVRSSNITISVPAAGTETNVGVYAPRAVFVKQEGGIVLSSDLSVTDEKGQPLYQRIFYGGSVVGNRCIYSTESGTEILNDENKLSTCVNITSTVKTQKIQDQKKIDDVMALINAIGSVTENSAQQIEAARAAYEALSAELKSRITNYGTLQAAETAYQKITEKKAQNDWQGVIDLINAIGNVTENSLEQIEAARAAYEKLGAEQKKQVTNYKKLETAETSYKKIEKEIEKRKVAKAIGLIKKIGKVTEKSEKKIRAAREAYDAIKDSYKKDVTNYKTLQKAEKTYKKIEKAKGRKVTVKNAVSGKKNSVVLTWKRNKTVDGYQIVYSQNKKFKNKKTIQIGKNKTTKTTIGKLKSQKTYYIKMRTYTKVNGQKVYGKWSKVRKVTVK